MALTTEAPCVVPGFEAARDAGCAERTPVPLLIGDDCLPVHLPVASVRAAPEAGRPALVQGEAGPHCLPTGPCSSYWPGQRVRELGETDFPGENS